MPSYPLLSGHKIIIYTFSTTRIAFRTIVFDQHIEKYEIVDWNMRNRPLRKYVRSEIKKKQNQNK